MRNDIWAPYFQGDESKEHLKKKQEYSSAKTARIQIPRTHRIIEASGLYSDAPVLLDIGCGIGNRIFEMGLSDLGVTYHGCDIFNQPKEVNQGAISACRDGQAELITINSVLNTIKEPEIRDSILMQAKNALNPESGRLMIIVYEGEKLAAEKALEKATGNRMGKLPPIETSDGFQNRFKTWEYVDSVKRVFPSVQLINMGKDGGNVIVASLNPSLDLDLKAMTKQQKNLSFMKTINNAMHQDEQKAVKPESAPKQAMVVEAQKIKSNRASLKM